MYVWGERQGNYEIVDFDDIREKFDWREALHKQAFVYRNGKYERFV